MPFGKRYTHFLPAFTLAAIALFGAGCKKEDGIVNNNVVRTPYSLYFGNVNGLVQNTNDGLKFKVIYKGPSVPQRSLITSGMNLISIQYNGNLGHPGQDLGVLQPGEQVFTSGGGIGMSRVNPAANYWPNMIIDVPSQDAVYVASVTSPGIEVSPDHGVKWYADITPNLGQDLTKVTSFTQTRDGNVYALDNTTPQVFQRSGAVLQWASKGAGSLPSGGFFLSHINNTLLAGDHSGTGGVYYSTDQGGTWTSYSGLDASQQVLSLNAPFDQVVLAGMDSVGIYRLVTDATGAHFVASNNGLDPFTSVYGIVGKQDIYKNDVIKQYIYIATSKGLFRSEDLGQNWTKMSFPANSPRDEDLRVIY